MQQGSVGCYESQVPVNLEKKIRVKDSTELKDNHQDDVITVKTVEKGAAGGEDRDNLVVSKDIINLVQPVRINNQNNLGSVTTENNNPEVKVKMEIQEIPDGLTGDQMHNHHHQHHHHHHHHRSVKKETVIKEGCSDTKAELTTNKSDQLSSPSSSVVPIGHRNAPTNVDHHNEPSVASLQKTVGSDFLKPSSQYHPHHPSGYHHPGTFPGMGGGKIGSFNFQNFYAASTPFQIHGQHNSPGLQHHPANKVSSGHHGHSQNTHQHQHPVTNSTTNSGFRGRPPLQSNNENYLHHRFNNNFHHLATSKLQQHQPTGSSHTSSVPPTPTGATVSNYPGFQTTVSSNSSSLQLTSQQNCNAAAGTIQAYNNHQNNNYRTHYPRHRKWNNPTGLRGLHPPPMPWPTWFFRPEIPPISSASVTTNVSNSLNGPISSSLTPRIHPEVSKAQDTPKDGSKVHGQTPTICTSIRCTVNGCSCDSFTPGKRHLRYCDKCHHGWVPHALARLSSSNGVGGGGGGVGVGGDVASSPLPCGRDENGAVGRVGRLGGGEERSAEQEVEKSRSPESVEPTAAFDVASLVLYGSRALPIRLKILLDQLFNQLPHPQVTRLLAAFGWTNEDYSRGYILQDSQNGPVLDRWSICSAEEEPLVLQQFLRFAETRPFVQQLLLAAGTPGSDAMSPSRRPSPPTMPLAHLPPPLHLLHCGLPPPGSRLPPPPVPPVSHPSMSPSSAHKHVYNPITGSSNAPTTPTTIGGNNSPPRTTMENSHLTVSPLNRLQSMQPFDFRKLGALGLPGFPPLPPPPPADILLGSRKSMRHSQSCYSPPHHLSNSQLRPPVPTMPPVSSAALNFSHSLAAAVSSGTLPPNFPNHFPPPPMIGKPNSGGMQTTTNAVDMHSSGEKSSDFGSEDDEDDDENSGSALNLSRRDSIKHDHHHNHHHHNHNHHHHHHQMSMQPAPLGRPPGVPGRKPHSPGKRQQWGTSPNLPLNLGTQFINPATGKKRVQCNVCLKTFCDKGALKIHFSAVHLREMHKCTVEGCNMMFSSRRSRNRHSANPNPKLHSPHLRRKISPHDGRSSMAHALVLPPQVGLPVPATGLNPLSFGSFPLLTPPPDLRHSTSLAALDFKHLDLSSTQNNRGYEEFQQRRTSSNTTASMSPPAPPTIPEGEEDDDDDDGIVVVAEDENQLQPQREDHEDRGDQPADFSLAKRPRLSVSDLEDDLASNADSNEEDSMSTTDQQSSSVRKNSLNSNLIHLGRGVRKRKSQNPTRCAMPAEIHSSSTDGDSSNDAIFQDQPEDMSMSRLQEVEEGKTESPSPKNLVSSRESRSNSGSPKTSCTGEREPETEPIDIVPVNSSPSNNGAAGAPAGVLKVEEEPLQEEPRDLSSRASSGRRSPAIRQRTVTPEPKTVSPSTPPPEISSPGPGQRDTSLKEEKRDDPDDEDDRDELDDDDDEDERPMQEGERPDDPPRAPSSVDSSHLTTADDLSLDSSNALRQLESLSQGRMLFGTLEASRSGRISTSPTCTLTMDHIELHSNRLDRLDQMELMDQMDTFSHGSRSSSASPSTTGMDTDNSLITYARYENGGFVSTQEVPLDRDNPRRCTACGKVFQNHFGVKTHYQNVHLKLMHRCSVDGCNAAFPSKRSRDRHSANLNLHRKLLSTSSSPPLANLPSTASLPPHLEEPQLNPALLHNEFFARLYADAGIGALGASYPLPPGVPTPVGVDLAARIPPPHPLLLPPHLGTFPGLSSFATHLAGLNGITQHHLNHLTRISQERIINPHNISPRSGSPVSSSPNPDQESGLQHQTVQICKEETARCMIPGCDRVFNSKAVRDAHSRDPQAHRDLPPVLSTNTS